jgi:uncharacterized OB-fold protein
VGDLPAAPPDVDPETAPFWAAAAEDRLVLPRCRACRWLIWYPRAVCPMCHHAGVEWVEMSGRGSVYSFTVSHRGPAAWAEHTPYVVAYVELEEGPRMLTNIVGPTAGEVAIGDQVEVVFAPAGTTKLVRFTRCRAPDVPGGGRR